MSGYELKDAKFLLTFYETKMIGQNLWPETDQKILLLGMEGDNDYELYAYGKATAESGVVKRTVAAVARELSLPDPAEVLRSKKRQTAE